MFQKNDLPVFHTTLIAKIENMEKDILGIKEHLKIISTKLVSQNFNKYNKIFI